ncbi:MAG: radical SAM protein [Betaproteobacteria bacterium]|nr:radical SAM protein [Betaproteobacteria bacterium]
MNALAESRPQVVSWNVTQACNLRCPHCYLGAAKRAARELSTKEGLSLIDELAALGTELLILTGGEPLLRRDLLTLARHASGSGLMVVVGTNGTLLDAHAARALKESWVRGVGISLDSLDPEKHDAFRGQKGAWNKALRAIEVCLAEGLEVALQTSVLPMNHEEVPRLAAFAREKGVRAFNAYFLVCTGRGEKLTDITPQQHEALLEELIAVQARHSGEEDRFMVRAKCAPHVKRLVCERLRRGDISPVAAVMLLAGAGCPAGRSYLRIGPEGDVTPCPYLPVALGNVRRQPLREIWQQPEPLQKLRRLELRGRCGACEFREPCGGCRARALAASGDLFGEDPWCTHQPAARDAAPGRSAIAWTEEALARIAKVPPFLRSRVMQGVEAYAGARGIASITPELLIEVRAAFTRSRAAGRTDESSKVG